MNAQAYAHPEYDALRVVRCTEIVGITLDGWKVKHRVTVFDFGKRPIDAANPDAVIAGDGTDVDGNPFRQRKPAAKTELLLDRIYELLARKPLNARQLAHETGETVGRIQGILREYKAGLVVLRRGTWGNIYGLEGQNYATPLVSPLMQAIISHLRTHGPTSTPDLCEALQADKTKVQNAIATYPGMVEAVGTARARGKRATVWGLV